jgi:hypothetical protein
MKNDPEKERSAPNRERGSEPIQWQTNKKSEEPGNETRDVETDRQERSNNLG